MERSDIMSVIMVAAIGSIVAFVVMNMVLGGPQNVPYKTVSQVSGELAEPDSEIFNYGAINPTVEVYVGSCEDIDRDGILSDKELEACSGKNEDDPDYNPEDDPDLNPPEE